MRQSTPQFPRRATPDLSRLGPSPTSPTPPQPSPSPAKPEHPHLAPFRPARTHTEPTLARPSPTTPERPLLHALPVPSPSTHAQRIPLPPTQKNTQPIPALRARNNNTLSSLTPPPHGDHAQPLPARNRAHPHLTRPHPSISNLDTELHRLARGAGRLRLRIGQALHRLGSGIHDLGFSTLGAYALERCNRGARWAAETRTLARRLQSLPHLTTALESGTIGWSMAELLARHATPQTEAALLQVARNKTVQAMRIALSHQASPPPPIQHETQDNEDLIRTLSLTLPVEEAWALEATRMMVEHMDGKRTGGHFLESLLAEATITLLELPDPPQTGAAQPHVTKRMEAEHAAWLAQMQRLQHQQAEAELKCRPEVPTNFTPDPEPGEAPDPSDLPTTLEALDARIRHYSAELASRDLFFGRLAQRFSALRGWQTLGFATEAHYARERLGMSRAALRSKIALARRTEGLHHIVDALQQGHIGFEAAHLLARIATPTTERAWVTRATRRTFKHLREEVQAVELTTRLLGQTDHSPPTEAHIKQMQSLERAILSGELLKKVIHREPPNPHKATSNERTPVQISVGPESNEAHCGAETNATLAHPIHDGSAHSTPVQISVTPNKESRAVQISGSPNDEAPAVEISVGLGDEPATIHCSGSTASEFGPSDRRTHDAESEFPADEPATANDTEAVAGQFGSPDHTADDVQSESPGNEPATANGPATASNEAPRNTVQISVTAAAKVTLRFRVPGDVLLLYRQLERLHRKKLPGTSFVEFLCTTFWQTWVPTLGTSDRWETIYRRDRYRCTSPVCHQRNVTLHHVKYQSHGGTDDPDNLTSPCAFCHLEGEHGGRLKILPPGDNPTWLLGRHPIMRVHSRERTLLA